jgi:hypothetical protein
MNGTDEGGAPPAVRSPLEELAELHERLRPNIARLEAATNALIESPQFPEDTVTFAQVEIHLYAYGSWQAAERRRLSGMEPF